MGYLDINENFEDKEYVLLIVGILTALPDTDLNKEITLCISKNKIADKYKLFYTMDNGKINYEHNEFLGNFTLKTMRSRKEIIADHIKQSLIEIQYKYL